MRVILTLLIAISGLTATGQIKNDSIVLLDSLYLTALEARLDLAQTNSHIYFELTENTLRIKDKVGIDNFIFLDNNKLIDKSIKERKTLLIYRVVHNRISTDTIDINFGTLTLKAKRKLHFNHGLQFKTATFTLSCGGTRGYNPDFRFVFDKVDNKWKMIINKYAPLLYNKDKINDRR